MRFTEAYEDWQAGRLRQEETARLLGVCERSFRRYIDRYEEEGLQGLIDRRLGQISHRRAPVDEVMALTNTYRARRLGWSAKHYYAWYRRAGGPRGYTWVKRQLQKAELIRKAPKRGAHRKRRERSPLPGMLIHQDGSRHEWVPDQRWDLIVTMDDATGEHYAMEFVEEEGIRSQPLLVHARGGGKVDKTRPTQFGRALQQLGIQMIAAYSPQARGRSERAFRTHQGRLVRELALHGVTDMAGANEYLHQHYQPAFNLEFKQPAQEVGSAFVPCHGTDIAEILCEHFERTAGNDNCVSFDTLKLQIPPQRHRCHFVKARVRVHRYIDGSLSIFHGPRCLARYTAAGQWIEELKHAAA